MNEEAETEARDEELCLRCMEPNPEGTSRCLGCGAPLGPSASTHPWEMKSATHRAYAPAANPRTKPIIFWGVWLYFGPSAFIAPFYLRDLIRDYRSGDPYLQPDFGMLMSMALPLLYGVLSCWALWSVTKGYLVPKPKPPQEKAAAEDDQSPPL